MKKAQYTVMKKVWGFAALFLTPGKHTYISDS